MLPQPSETHVNIHKTEWRLTDILAPSKEDEFKTEPLGDIIFPLCVSDDKIEKDSVLQQKDLINS